MPKKVQDKWDTQLLKQSPRSPSSPIAANPERGATATVQNPARRMSIVDNSPVSQSLIFQSTTKRQNSEKPKFDFAKAQQMTFNQTTKDYFDNQMEATKDIMSKLKHGLADLKRNRAEVPNDFMPSPRPVFP